MHTDNSHADGVDPMFDDNLPADHRSGFVTVVGRPNVGKSTLVNRYLGQKIAIVSPKPQTTRNQLVGILTLPNSDYPDINAQVIFLDTPGIHRPHHKLGEYLVDTAQAALPDADVVVWLADVTRPPGPEEEMVAGAIAAARARNDDRLPVILALNKIDALTGDIIMTAAQPFLKLLPVTFWLPLSATRGDNLRELLEQIVGYLPPGPRYYPADQVTDQQVRFISAELIREAALNVLRQEVPHALAVQITEFTPRSEELTFISANLILERDSHKRIVIGEKGQTLRKIGQQARKQIADLTGTKIYLELWVKVRPKWRTKENELKWLGYSTR
ncbi:MAG: GTPase Era [Anaerolineae bacterium]